MAHHSTLATDKHIHTLILDTGPIIKNTPAVSSLLQQAECLITTPAVISEIRDAATRSRFETTLLPFLTLRNPKPASYETVAQFAKKTGDFVVLSRPDLEILALAYELDCERKAVDKISSGQKASNGSPAEKQTETKIQSEPETQAEIPVLDSSGSALKTTALAETSTEQQSKTKTLPNQESGDAFGPSIGQHSADSPFETTETVQPSENPQLEELASTAVSERSLQGHIPIENSGLSEAAIQSAPSEIHLLSQTEDAENRQFEQPTATGSSPEAEELVPTAEVQTQTDAPTQDPLARQNNTSHLPKSVSEDQINPTPTAGLNSSLSQLYISSKSEENESQTPSPPEEDEPAAESSDDDSDGWITPSNLQKHLNKDSSRSVRQVTEPKTMQVATLTTDFAMQNVLLQMKLHVLSTSLARIRHLNSYILRCHACFFTIKQMEKQFCPRCGKPTLTRVACSVDHNGEFKLHLKKNFQWNRRGERYSIPKAVSGSANGRVNVGGGGKGGGKQGWGQELILVEDQKEYTRAIVEQKRQKTRDLMDEDYLPNILSGERGRAGGKPKVGAGRNVNSKKRG
ncbi:hypothetical protein K432DRAFT_382066 [Lepidopterella palustris CBS 459.81]|uniref:20S-pre-rRNA D-site endonuclease NOB1 n=1 Tax=Lepidopterella palustris CBS 459.81 TaxID=1314670 RepID=A0A8E2EBN5_9PEZI|nr:hypothetical protein K432DRAFT_382066 [Lepidopterella palustris CBS 459.81]